MDNPVLNQRLPIIAIDGPAGAGKSTVSRQIADSLGLLYLDTGAMYRAVAWLVLQSGLKVDDEEGIAALINQVQIQLIAPQEDDGPIQVKINDQDVTKEIRTPEVTAQVSAVAKLAAVRQALVAQQRSWGQQGGIVADGRDIGTHVFPDAELKIFLTASATERARRRQQDLIEQGETNLSLEELEKSIKQRDLQDSTRQIAPLRKAESAIEINTDGLSIDTVVEKIIKLYHRCQQRYT